MKVSELIELLKGMPQDFEVELEGYTPEYGDADMGSAQSLRQEAPQRVVISMQRERE